MKHLSALYFILRSLTLISHSLSAREIFVAPNDNDTNDGNSEDTPHASITRVSAVVQARDTLKQCNDLPKFQLIREYLEISAFRFYKS